MNKHLQLLLSEPRWNVIIPSYLIAWSFALVSRLDVAEHWYFSLTNGTIFQQWTFLPAGLGTVFAVLFARRFDTTTPKTITIIGNHWLKNTIITIVPASVFTGFGISHSYGLDAHGYAGIFALTVLIYAVCEEIYWRGYLQDALRSIGSKSAVLIIGMLWWAWHLRFSSIFDWTGFLLICVGSTFLLYKFANETQSTLTTAGLHSFIILTTNGTAGGNSILYPSILTIALWISIAVFWKPAKQQQTTE